MCCRSLDLLHASERGNQFVIVLVVVVIPTGAFFLKNFELFFCVCAQPFKKQKKLEWAMFLNRGPMGHIN